MKVFVDDSRCRGHGVCVALCPEVFSLTDGGYAVAIHGDVAEEFQITVRDAITSCPENAISEETAGPAD